MLSFNPESAPRLLENIWAKENLRSHNILCGINEDDCSIISIGDIFIGITTDYLNSKPICVEFNIAEYFDLGRLTVASNISDLLGSGLCPHSFMLGVMLKRNMSEGDFLELIRGIKFELDKYEIPLIGGDTKLGNENAFAGIAIGTANNKKELFLKNRASSEDKIFISGHVGSVAAAIAFMKSDYCNLEEHKELKDWSCTKLIEPSLPFELSRTLSKLELSLGGTDISDGLSADLYDLCRASNVGAIINPILIPLDDNVKKIAVLLNIDEWKFPFLTGGDFQFIFTVNKCHIHKVKNLNCFEIGEITKDINIFMKYRDSLKCLLDFGHSDSNNVSFADEIAIHLEKL